MLFKDLDLIRKYAKPVDFWTVNFSYFFSLRLVSLIQNTGITPDMLTWSSLLLTIAGVVILFIFPHIYGWWLVAGILFQFSYILDCADGQLARYKQKFSPNGWRIDLYTDRIKEHLILISLTYVVVLYKQGFWIISMFAMALEGMLKYIRLQETLKATTFQNKIRWGNVDLSRVNKYRKKLGCINNLKKRFNLGFMNIGEFYFFNFICIIFGEMEFFFYLIIVYSLFSLIYYLLNNLINEVYFEVNFSRFLEEEKEIVLFGTGSGGRNLLANLLEKGIKIGYICDNNAEKWGSSLYGVIIHPPAQLKLDRNKVNVLIASTWWYDISKQLKAYGLTDEQILSVYY